MQIIYKLEIQTLKKMGKCAKSKIMNFNFDQVRRLLRGQLKSWEQPTGYKYSGKPKTMKEAAERLGTTTHRLKTYLRALLDAPPGTDLSSIQQPALGRPRKQLGLNEENINHIISRDTLRLQTGWSLAQRAMHINQRFGSRLNTDDLRKIYKNYGVSKQKLVAQLQPPMYKPAGIQQAELEVVKARYQQAMDDGFEVLQYDQCLFSANRYEQHHWAPVGKPLITKSKWVSQPVVVVCGFISE
jgi:transposase